MNSASASSTASQTARPTASQTASQTAGPCIGRFAPSPSGPLHFGSLVSAVASYLDIKSRTGQPDNQWLLRIDDLDAPRATAGSESSILATLQAHAIFWDGTPSRQSDHLSAYHNALERLAGEGLLYCCTCSRKSLKGIAVYPGHCRPKLCTPEVLLQRLSAAASADSPGDWAVRLRLPDQQCTVTDELQGTSTSNLAHDNGDYVVYRRDGLVSYQLAVVIDDGLTGVNRVVRGADLMPTTARQQHLHELLNQRSPAWLHLPVLLNSRGRKLSKQAHSLAVDDKQANTNLDIALQLLGQSPPAEAMRMPVAELMSWAIDHWQPARLPTSPAWTDFYGW